MRIVKQTALLYFFISLATCAKLHAQDSPTIVFDQTEHDFGEIKEENGPVTYEFTFINEGAVPLVLSSVRASCGCTTPSWTKEPVLPGQKGSITAKYNPRNRPGSFRKTLTITHNGTEPTSRLYIKGKVLPRVKTLEERLPYVIGNTRMKSRSVNFGRVTTQRAITKKLQIHNGGMEVLHFTNAKAPDYIQIKFPEGVAPDSTGVIELTYDPLKRNDLGYFNDGVEFSTNEATKNVKTLNVYATISEYFPPLSAEESEMAPVLHIVDRMKELGNITKGEIETTFFTLQNDGKSTLNIRKIESNCTCIKASVEDENIKAGASTTLKIIFNSANRRGRQTKSISIYSNDPKDPTQVVTVLTSVVDPK